LEGLTEKNEGQNKWNRGGVKSKIKQGEAKAQREVLVGKNEGRQARRGSHLPSGTKKGFQARPLKQGACQDASTALDLPNVLKEKEYKRGGTITKGGSKTSSVPGRLSGKDLGKSSFGGKKKKNVKFGC